MDWLKVGVAASGDLGRASEVLGLAVISLQGRLSMLLCEAPLVSVISSQCAFVCLPRGSLVPGSVPPRSSPVKDTIPAVETPASDPVGLRECFIGLGCLIWWFCSGASQALWER